MNPPWTPISTSPGPLARKTLPADGSVSISQVYNDRFKGYAGFADAVTRYVDVSEAIARPFVPRVRSLIPLKGSR